MTMKRMDLVQAVFRKCQPINVPQLFKISQEVELCSNYLYNLQDKVDVSKSSRWFREPGNMSDRKKLIEKGFTRYQQFTSPVNSVTVANYIKTMLREIPGGLVPASCQELLIDILSGKDGKIMIKKAVDDHERDAVRAILGIVPIRHEIIKNVVRLCDLILKKGVIDPIGPEALARIITVTSEDRLDRVENKDQRQIQKLLNEWHSVWGKIISNQQLFF